MTLIGLLLWSCKGDCPPGSARNDAGLCELFAPDSGGAESDTPGDTADGDTTGHDTGQPGAQLELGDPITTIRSTAQDDGAAFAEWVDAVVFNETEAVTVGVTGTALINLDTLETTREFNTNRAYHVDVDPKSRIAIVGTIHDGLRRVELDSGAVSRISDGPGDTGHADVSIDGDVVAVAWRSEGLWLFNSAMEPITTVAGQSVTAVAVHGDRLLYTDETALILMDVADPASPVELDRISIPASAMDLDFDGSRAAVGLGGRGALVAGVDADTLSSLGTLDIPGNANSVALDGDDLWIAAWEVTALAWLGGNTPVVVGHEAPAHSAMGIGAGGGRALVADWFSVTTLQRNEDVAGPELHIPRQLYTQADRATTMMVTNHGAFDLDFEVLEPEGSFSVEPMAATLAPGQGQAFSISHPSTNPPNSQISWRSNDPDEPSGAIPLTSANSGVGNEHPDFTLSGFTWPDRSLQSFRLSDYKGKALFLAYWADY